MRLCLYLSRLLVTGVIVLSATTAIAVERTFVAKTPRGFVSIEQFRVLAWHRETHRIVTAKRGATPNEVTIDIPEGDGWEITVTVKNVYYVGTRKITLNPVGAGPQEVVFSPDNFTNVGCNAPTLAPIKIRKYIIGQGKYDLKHIRSGKDIGISAVEYLVENLSQRLQDLLVPKLRSELDKASNDVEAAAVMDRAVDRLQLIIDLAQDPDTGINLSNVECSKPSAACRKFTKGKDDTFWLPAALNKFTIAARHIRYRTNLVNQIKEAEDALQKCKQPRKRRAKKTVRKIKKSKPTKKSSSSSGFSVNIGIGLGGSGGGNNRNKQNNRNSNN